MSGGRVVLRPTTPVTVRNIAMGASPCRLVVSVPCVSSVLLCAVRAGAIP